MSLRDVERIADTLLYEGYLLYPYRANAVKNRQRFNFGVLYPSSYAGAHTGEKSLLQTECLVRGDLLSRIHVNVRFLQLADRTVGQIVPPSATSVSGDDPRIRQVEHLDVDERTLRPWQDASEAIVTVAATIGELVRQPLRHPFAFEGDQTVEQVRDASGMTAAILVRRKRPTCGELVLTARPVEHGLFILGLVVENQTVLHDEAQSRDEMLLSAFISAHAIFTVADGIFVSLLDPPEDAREAASACVNNGVWPVLVREPGNHDALLASPIIVYDYPTLAPESPGDFYDATEMDEMLALRILTLTDDEKLEMASTDHRSRALLERTQSLAADQMMRLHGVMRSTDALETGQR